MTRTIEVDLPREALAAELSRALGAQGLHAVPFAEGDRCALRVGFSESEEDRLVGEVTRTIEEWLGARQLPLVVQRANGGCVVRPPGD
jgi:hypothetical protein